MKKIKLFCLTLLTALMALLGFACIERHNPPQCTLSVFDPYGHIVTELDKKYRAGEEITVIVRDGYSGIRVGLYLNEQEITDFRPLEHPYVLFHFKMPYQNATLYVSPPYYPDDGGGDISHDSSSGHPDETPPIQSSISSLPETNSATFTAQYDYGRYIQTSDGVPMVSTLLDGNALFFNPTEWNVETPLLAGEKLTVYYTGEMHVAESYPGQVVIEDGNIQRIEKTRKARVSELYYNGEILYAAGFSVEVRPAYAINADGTFITIEHALQALQDGERLWAAYNFPNDGLLVEGEHADVDYVSVRLNAVYTYNPYYHISASTLMPWINYLQAENVDSIKVKSYNRSLGPNGFVETRVTDDKQEIEKMLDYMKKLSYKQLSREEAEIDGGDTIEYTFTDKSGQTYAYSNYAGCFHQDEKYYAPSAKPPVITIIEEWYQSFQYYQPTFDLHVDGKYAKTYDNFLPKIHFLATNEYIELPQWKYVIYHDGDPIYILNERYFTFAESNVTCKIVGEKDFSEILEEYPPDGGTEIKEKYSLTVEGATDVLTSENISEYAAGEEVTLTTEVLMDACVAMYLNGEYIGLGSDIEIDGRTHWAYSFSMPKKDSILRVQVEEGFLPEVEKVTFSVQYIRASIMINQTHMERVSSVEQLIAHGESNKDEYNGFESVLLAFEKYDEEYFARKSLLIVSLEENSSSISHAVKSIEITMNEDWKNTVTVIIERILPDGDGDCAMQPWYILIEVSKYNRIESGNLQVKLI
jgi:hypothetical protein